MAAARDQTRSIAEAMRAHRHAAPVGLACGALIASVMLLGNPFAASAPAQSHPPQPEISPAAAELSLPDPAAAPVPPAPQPAPAPIGQAATPKFAVPPAPPVAAPAPPLAPTTHKMGGGRRATIIVETLPAKPIIPPFVPKQPAGAAPEPHPPLPLDTEPDPAAAASTAVPGPKTAAASLPRNG